VRQSFSRLFLLKKLTSAAQRRGVAAVQATFTLCSSDPPCAHVECPVTTPHSHGQSGLGFNTGLGYPVPTSAHPIIVR